MQDITALLGTAWVIKKLGVAGYPAALALGALNGKGKKYDEHMDEALKKSQDELWKNGACRDMRQDGLTDEQARFAIANRHARMESDAAALFGAMKEFFIAGVGKVVRDGTEGGFMKGSQDQLGGQGADIIFDFLTGRKKEDNNQ